MTEGDRLRQDHEADPPRRRNARCAMMWSATPHPHGLRLDRRRMDVVIVGDGDHARRVARGDQQVVRDRGASVATRRPRRSARTMDAPASSGRTASTSRNSK